MKKKLIIIILILIVAISTATFFFFRNEVPVPSITSANLTKEYINTKYNFSLTMPEDFVAREIELEESSVILVENEMKTDGIQIMISAVEEDTHILTADMIKTDIPDLKISDEQPVDIGEDYKGVAFKSDNQSFGGASREVWFIFRGNLYQISTYDRLDDLLKRIFKTWRFN